MADKVTLLNSSQSIELEIKNATVGPSVIDLKNLYQDTDFFTYDPSYSTTASCESTITYIDGAKGILEYRGYPIEQLAEDSTYLEVAYLLFNGELPTSKIALDEFRSEVKQRMTLPENMDVIFSGFSKDAHPMAMLTTSVAALSGSYHQGIEIRDKLHQKDFFFNILGKVPILVASIFNHNRKDAVVEYDESLSYSENILRLFFGWQEGYETDPILSKALDILLILHADHEQNCSTSSVRLTGSSGTNPYAAIAAGVAALWGPAHGGANEAVLKMLSEIGTVDRIGEFVNKAKDKNDPFRLFGFGHRVYKNYDPRAAVMRVSCHEVLDLLGVKNDPLLEIAMELEKIALNDEYFIEKKLYPNVDFYSGIILKAMGFPTDMFTVLFAVARTVGWVAQWNEMITDPVQRIGRPRQLYTGQTERDFVDLNKR